ncbi:MAG: hypothetical protein ABW221_27125 [Vicinamibacteria bacterium]
MKRAALFSVVAVMGLLSSGGCVPEWAQQNSSPYIMEIASITNADGELPITSDVNNAETGGFENDNAVVTVNLFRKNNNDGLGTTAVEHVYLERYEVRYFRTDGHNVEGQDVPYRVTGPMGNVRFHTVVAGEEVEAETIITIVRHQAKLEPPLRNLRIPRAGDSGSVLVPQQAIFTAIAEITIHGRTVQGDALQAVGRVPVTFGDFADADEEAPTPPTAPSATPTPSASPTAAPIS